MAFRLLFSCFLFPLCVACVLLRALDLWSVAAQAVGPLRNLLPFPSGGWGGAFPCPRSGPSCPACFPFAGLPFFWGGARGLGVGVWSLPSPLWVPPPACAGLLARPSPRGPWAGSRRGRGALARGPGPGLRPGRPGLPGGGAVRFPRPLGPLQVTSTSSSTACLSTGSSYPTWAYPGRPPG